MQMQKRVRRFRRRRIRQWLHLKRLELKERQGGVHPSKEDVTIGTRILLSKFLFPPFW